jgi:diguanylate cyclase (GGDEF)-like protein/PAS domain S-box-containing protein
MARRRLFQSVVTRLVTGLVVVGLGASAGLSVLELNRSEPKLQLEITRQTAQVVRNIQAVLRGQLHDQTKPTQIMETLQVLGAEGFVRAVRLSSPHRQPIALGSWPHAPETVARVWPMPEHGTFNGKEVDIQRLTFVQAPFAADGGLVNLELLIDGPAARDQLRHDVITNLLMEWLFLCITVLLGLLMMRRWVAKPLLEIMELVRGNSGPQPFYDMSRSMQGEFAQLAEAVGGMLTRIECTSQALRQREQAFQNLYQFAPAAMLSLDAAGHILEANHRCAQLLERDDEKKFLGEDALLLVVAEDRPLLRQTIDRLDIDSATRCDLRVRLDKDRTLDVAVECTAVRDEDGLLQSVRLSLLDISQAKQLQERLAQKSQLLNLVIDHMSDAILLVDAEGRIAACNQKLGALLQCRTDALMGRRYDVESFWDDLGLASSPTFVNRMRQIEADITRPAQERFETRLGTLLFQGIPVHDALQNSVGRLWVVSESTMQQQNQRLLHQQTSQLQSLKTFVQRLQRIDCVDRLLQEAADQLYTMFGVEAVGIAVRNPDDNRRSIQVIHRGFQPYLLTAHQALVDVIETRLMPTVLERAEVAMWPELPRGVDWSAAFGAAGLTCLAAGPLCSGDEQQGIVWVARRGGERIDRNHLFLLETLAPVLAARVEVTRLVERLHAVELTDPVTDLPTEQPFVRNLTRLTRRPGYPWAVVLINVDHFSQINQKLSHASADAVLREVANTLRAGTRSHCYLNRLDGATFGVVAPGYTRREALALAERLRERIALMSVPLPDHTTLPLTASIGLSCCPLDGGDLQQVIAIARRRMGQARAQGRDRVIADDQPAADSRQAG